jgi:hypothetical protein
VRFLSSRTAKLYRASISAHGKEFRNPLKNYRASKLTHGKHYRKNKKGKSLPDGCSGHSIVTEKNKKKQRPEASPLSPPPTAPAICRGKGWAGRAVPPRSACCQAP